NGRSAPDDASARRQIAWSEIVVRGEVISFSSPSPSQSRNWLHVPEACAHGAFGPSRPSRLRSSGRLGGGRVLGPEMAGIAATKVGAHGGPGAAPKARQVARDLDRAVGGREQVE